MTSSVTNTVGNVMTETVAKAPPIDAAQCPRCGQPNRCAMEVEKASGLAQPPCWCSFIAFEPAALASLAPAARGRVCICAACATSGPSRDNVTKRIEKSDKISD